MEIYIAFGEISMQHQQRTFCHLHVEINGNTRREGETLRKDLMVHHAAHGINSFADTSKWPDIYGLLLKWRRYTEIQAREKKLLSIEFNIIQEAFQLYA